MKIIRGDDHPFVPASHENPTDPGVWKKVLLARDDAQPGRLQMVNWARMPVAQGFAAHYHEDMQELFVIIRGRAEIWAGEQNAQLAAGDAVLIDAREVHRMANRGDEELDYLALGVSTGSGGRTIVVEPKK